VRPLSWKAFGWKRSRISVLKVEAVLQSFILSVKIGLTVSLNMRTLFLVESFDLCPSNHYILVRAVPSCFPFAK
jgi:hypothetical protein